MRKNRPYPASILRLTTPFVAALLLAAPVCLHAAKPWVVAADGSGEFTTVQAAIAAAPANSSRRTIIHIEPGTYRGPFLIPKDKSNISLVGDDARTTILTFDRNIHDPKLPGQSQKYRGITVAVVGNGFRARNITFQNTSGDHGQALALRLDGDRGIITHCRLLGWQDTLRCEKHRQYFVDCYIEGRVDFIYGSGTAVFDHCELHSKDGGFVTAASTPKNVPFGFVFLHCHLTGDPTPWAPPGHHPKHPKRKPFAELGRPWGHYASVTYIDCRMDGHIRPEGWNDWGDPANHKTVRFAEYHSTGPGAAPRQRVPWSHQLTATQAAAYTITNVLGGKDHWNPAGNP